MLILVVRRKIEEFIKRLDEYFFCNKIPLMRIFINFSIKSKPSRFKFEYFVLAIQFVTDAAQPFKTVKITSELSNLTSIAHLF